MHNVVDKIISTAKDSDDQDKKDVALHYVTQKLETLYIDIKGINIMTLNMDDKFQENKSLYLSRFTKFQRIVNESRSYIPKRSEELYKSVCSKLAQVINLLKNLIHSLDSIKELDSQFKGLCKEIELLNQQNISIVGEGLSRFRLKNFSNETKDDMLLKLIHSHDAIKPDSVKRKKSISQPSGKNPYQNR